MAFTGLFLASQIIIDMMTVGTFPNPYDPPQTAQAYFGANADILRWVAFLQAVLAELSSVSMVFPTVSPLLPLSRFPALIWLIAAGFAMPAARSAQRAA